MTRLALPLLGAALFVALLAPAVTHGKGATAGEIAGPGLDDPIDLNGTWNQLGRIAEAGGFYAAAFGREPNPLASEQPPGELGPRYTITYVMPGASGETNELVQDVYPYAKPSPVTYTAGGQPFFGTEETRAGWFVAAPSLRDNLVEAGLPPSAPPVSAEDPRGVGPAVVAAVVLGSVLAGCALAAVRLRRRPQTA